MINVKLIDTDFYTMVVHDAISHSNADEILRLAKNFNVAVMHDCIDSYLTIEGASDEFRRVPVNIGDKYIRGSCSFLFHWDTLWM